MKNTYFTILFLYMFYGFAMGQSNHRYVFSTGGDSFQTADYSGSFTMGEPIIGTVVTANITITQGFQQPVKRSLGTSEYILFNLEIAPNPSFGTFHLKNNQIMDELNVFDVYGRLIFTIQPKSNEYELLLSHLAKGIYWLKVKSENIGLSYKRLIIE